MELEQNYNISIVLSSIISNNTISVLQKIQQYRGEDWIQQFYERFSLFREIEGHNSQEVAQILYAYEELYRPFLSSISISKYAGNIFGWLTNSDIDIHQCRRVAIEHLAKLIFESTRIACIEYDMNDIPGDLLFHVYKTQLLERDKLYFKENTPIYKPNNKLKEEIV